jgi:glucose-6-phosphate 1-dehydrogenase
MSNAALANEIVTLKAKLAALNVSTGASVGGGNLEANKEGDKGLTVIVVGASGDLATKKTFPALYALHCHGLLPPGTIIAGYSRSKMDREKFITKMSSKFPAKYDDLKEEFCSRCFYHAGAYDSPEDFGALAAELAEKEKAAGHTGNRIFYLAIPPTIFVDVGKGVQPAAMSKTGWNRVIVEKPFGRDSESSLELGRQLAALFAEHQMYRIDHYLGKEMVQNLMVMRFANTVFEPLWNSNFIQCVIITFKENFGTMGRGGYFDTFGVIRDVLQNHLLQIMSLVAMEEPVSMGAEDVRDEKVKLLRCVAPIVKEDTVVGQYGAPADGSEPSYLEDPSLPSKDSVTPTFAALVLWIKNSRWNGTPFVLKAGKALNERKAEIRIQFRMPGNTLFEGQMSPNELVLRVQPDEAVYLKMSTKAPGLKGGVYHSELDLTYNQRFTEGDQSKLDLPDAYERLIYDVIRGDHNLFVRADELVAAWKIFTPILHQLEKERTKPIIYEYGGRGPKEADELIARVGYMPTQAYKWQAK